VAGGGHNGLVAAAYLARAGQKVLLLERRQIPGGACSTEELFPGYHFSTCSYICYLLQTKVIDDLDLRRHGFHIFPIDPWRFLPLPDGRRLLVWNDEDQTREEIARFSRHDAEAYPRWNAFWNRAAGILHSTFLAPPPTVAELAARLSADDAAFFQRLLGLSMRAVVEEFFESPVIRAAFIHAHDAGDPALPGSAWSYAYIKCSNFSPPGNVGLVRGGMGGIARALAASAREHGATIRLGAAVERVLVEQGRAIGVRLADGTEIRGGVVVSNADPKRTFTQLVAPEDLPPGFFTRIQGLSTRAAYLKFHASLDGVPDFSAFFRDGKPAFDPKFMAEVKICPSVEYFTQAWQDARRGDLARQPVMEVQMPSAYDNSVAPAGKHLLSIWALYAPVKPREGTWDARRDEAGEIIIDTLAAYAPNLRGIIRDWSLLTPLDMENRVGLTNGNIRHLDMVPTQMLTERPLGGFANYRTPIRNLYLCGAGTHPGGEVTGAPGHNAAMMILRDLGENPPGRAK
ncbi:MAG TPA: NAD(P)/FAD-dependent oxidoreductase, partial [Verrucomicrobiae bacterium]|nr:NAD(P)/FAD-dependent oxidoreductase [Verrucomicrobiae bacterium]